MEIELGWKAAAKRTWAAGFAGDKARDEDGSDFL